MKLHGEFTTIVTDGETGRIVLAQVYDTIRERDAALIKSIGPTYKNEQYGERFRIQIGRLPGNLPSLRGHPPENLARLAEQYFVPTELLLRAQSIDEERSRRAVTGFLARYRDLIIAVGLAIVTSALLYEARQAHFFMDAMNWLGALSALTFAAALSFLFRYCEDMSQFAVLGIGLFLAAMLFDAFFGQAFEILAEIARKAGEPRDGPD